MEQKINEAWVMHTITSEWITCYDIFTRAGFYRGGKIYHANKSVLILSGSCEMIIHKNWSDTTQVLTPDSGIIILPSWTPNIFYFPEDCRMLEWFESGCEIEKFQRYREMKK